MEKFISSIRSAREAMGRANTARQHREVLAFSEASAARRKNKNNDYAGGPAGDAGAAKTAPLLVDNVPSDDDASQGEVHYRRRSRIPTDEPPLSPTLPPAVISFPSSAHASTPSAKVPTLPHHAHARHRHSLAMDLPQRNLTATPPQHPQGSPPAHPQQRHSVPAVSRRMARALIHTPPPRSVATARVPGAALPSSRLYVIPYGDSTGIYYSQWTTDGIREASSVPN